MSWWMAAREPDDPEPVCRPIYGRAVAGGTRTLIGHTNRAEWLAWWGRQRERENATWLVYMRVKCPEWYE